MVAQKPLPEWSFDPESQKNLGSDKSTPEENMKKDALNEVEKLALFKVIQYGLLPAFDLETFLKIQADEFENVITTLVDSNLIRIETSELLPGQRLFYSTPDGMTVFHTFRKHDFKF
jgi:hypothetical protein